MAKPIKILELHFPGAKFFLPYSEDNLLSNSVKLSLFHFSQDDHQLFKLGAQFTICYDFLLHVPLSLPS